MNIGHFSVADDWVYESPALSGIHDECWYKRVTGLIDRGGLRSNDHDINLTKRYQHGYSNLWELTFQHSIFKEEYFRMYGNNAALFFKDIDDAKREVDSFLFKLSKLICLV